MTIPTCFKYAAAMAAVSCEVFVFTSGISASADVLDVPSGPHTVFASVRPPSEFVHWIVPDAAAKSTRSQQSRIRYVRTSCAAKWGNWAHLCCATYETAAACQKTTGDACTAIDVEVLREKTKNSKSAPAC